jgi:hypothetical protein
VFDTCQRQIDLTTGEVACQHKISIRKNGSYVVFSQHSCRIFAFGVRCAYYTNPSIHLLHHTAL